MKCTNCNNELTGTENFCRKCGFPVKKDNKIKEEIKENTADNNSETLEKLGNTSIDLNDIVSSNSIKKDEKYKIENTQELLVNNTDSSKKIKKILDELKFNKKEDNVSSSNNNLNDSDNAIKEQFEESKKKIANLEEKSISKKNDENNDLENKTILVNPISNDDKTNDEKKQAEETKEKKEIQNNIVDKLDYKEQSDAIKDEDNDIINKNKEIEENEEENIIIEDSNPNVDADADEIYEESSPSGGTGKFVFVLLLFILALCFSVYLLINNFSLKSKLNKSEEEYNKLSENISKTNSNNISSNSNSKSKVLYGCYLVNNEAISVLDSSISIVFNNQNFEFSIDSNSLFDEIKTLKDDYKKLLEKKNYTITSYGTKVIDEREYVFFDVTELQGEKYLIVYTAGLKNDSFMFKIKNNEQNVNFDYLKTINEYINTLKCENNNKISSSDYFIKK